MRDTRSGTEEKTRNTSMEWHSIVRKEVDSIISCTLISSRLISIQISTRPYKINNNNNNEILIKRELLVYTTARRVVQRKRRRKGLGQYNSNNKLIHGQYTSRYNRHHTHTYTHTHTRARTHARTHAHTHHTASNMT